MDGEAKQLGVMAPGVLKIALEATPVEIEPNQRIVRIAYTEIDYKAKLGDVRVEGHVLIVPMPLAVLVEIGAERWSVTLESILRAVLDQREAVLEESVEPANPLTHKRPPSKADLAVKYVLDRVQTDPDLYYHMVDTEAWEQLTASEAERLGLDVEDVRRQRRKDLQPTYRKRKSQLAVLKEFLERLDLRPGLSTEQIHDALLSAADDIESGDLSFDDFGEGE